MARTVFEQMGGQYVRQGDYELPALTVQPEEEHEVGVWSQRHRKWLKGQHRVLYYNLLTSGRLYAHLADVEERANKLFTRLTGEMARSEGVTEELKSMDMLAWVGQMNSIRNRATEVVNTEIIFTSTD